MQFREHAVTDRVREEREREKKAQIVFSPERAFRCGRKLAAFIPRGQTMGANRKNVAAKPRRARAKTISSSFTGP